MVLSSSNTEISSYGLPLPDPRYRAVGNRRSLTSRFRCYGWMSRDFIARSIHCREPNTKNQIRTKYEPNTDSSAGRKSVPTFLSHFWPYRCRVHPNQLSKLFWRGSAVVVGKGEQLCMSG